MKLKLSLVLVLVSVFSLQAQTVDEILAQHIENSGGKDAWSSIKSMEMSATIKSPQGEIGMKTIQMSPDKIYQEMNMMGQKIVQGFDGETAWMVNPMTGSTTPQPMPDALKQQFLENAQDMGSVWLDYASKGHKVTLEGSETVDGVDTYKIQLIRKKSDAAQEVKETYFFDKENYIPIAMNVTADQGPTAGMTIQTKLSDYKETNAGVLMAHYVETSVMGQSSSVVIDEIKVNVDVDENVFKMPSGE